MKRICLGTMITLLYQSRIRSTDKIKTICGGIFAAFGLDIENFNKELPSHLKSGHDPAPGVLIDAARDLSIEDIDRGFEEYVLPLIHNEKHEAVFRAIKDILRDDTSILGTTVVGKMAGFEKDNILNYESFDESALLANVVTYAIMSTENDKLGTSIREIGKGYIDGFVGSGENIYFISPLADQDQVSPLKRTLKDPMFDRIFKKATDITISGMSNPSKACVFYIDPNNCKFRFRDLKDFIINNIGSYVFSRAQIKRITDMTKNTAAVGSRAMLKFIEKFIESLGERFNIREIAFDRWGAVQMVQNLEGMGFTVVPMGQGFASMSPPTKELMKLTLEKKLAHGGHPVLRWNMDNIFIRTDPAGNIKADKSKSTEKIDGAIACIMALDRAIRCGNDTSESVYDSRGLIVL
jgi:hypothetical protein